MPGVGAEGGWEIVGKINYEFGVRIDERLKKIDLRLREIERKQEELYCFLSQNPISVRKIIIKESHITVINESGKPPLAVPAPLPNK